MSPSEKCQCRVSEAMATVNKRAPLVLKSEIKSLMRINPPFFRIFPKSLRSNRRPLRVYFVLPQSSNMFQDYLFLEFYIGNCSVPHIGSYFMTYAFCTWITIFISVIDITLEINLALCDAYRQL